MSFWNKIAETKVEGKDYKYFKGDGSLVVELLNVPTGETFKNGMPYMSPEFKVLEVVEDAGSVNPAGTTASYYLLLEEKRNGEPTDKGQRNLERAKKLAAACLGGIPLDEVTGQAIEAVFGIDPETGVSAAAGTVLLADVKTKVYPPTRERPSGGRHTTVSFTYLPERNSA